MSPALTVMSHVGPSVQYPIPPLYPLAPEDPCDAVDLELERISALGYKLVQVPNLGSLTKVQLLQKLIELLGNLDTDDDASLPLYRIDDKFLLAQELVDHSQDLVIRYKNSVDPSEDCVLPAEADLKLDRIYANFLMKFLGGAPKPKNGRALTFKDFMDMLSPPPGQEPRNCYPFPYGSTLGDLMGYEIIKEAIDHDVNIPLPLSFPPDSSYRHKLLALSALPACRRRNIDDLYVGENKKESVRSGKPYGRALLPINDFDAREHVVSFTRIQEENKKSRVPTKTPKSSPSK